MMLDCRTPQHSVSQYPPAIGDIVLPQRDCYPHLHSDQAVGRQYGRITTPQPAFKLNTSVSKGRGRPDRPQLAQSIMRYHNALRSTHHSAVFNTFQRPIQYNTHHKGPNDKLIMDELAIKGRCFMRLS